MRLQALYIETVSAVNVSVKMKFLDLLGWPEAKSCHQSSRSCRSCRQPSSSLGCLVLKLAMRCMVILRGVFCPLKPRQRGIPSMISTSFCMGILGIILNGTSCQLGDVKADGIPMATEIHACEISALHAHTALVIYIMLSHQAKNMIGKSRSTIIWTPKFKDFACSSKMLKASCRCGT